MLEIRKINSTNLTVLFELIDIRMIDSEALKNIVNMEKDGYGASVMENMNPPFKRMILPQSKFKVSIEQKKISIDDDSGKDPKDSELINKYYQNIINLVPQFKPTAFGFNYQVIASSKGTNVNITSKKLRNLVSKKNLLSEGASIVFNKNDIRYDLRLNRISPKEFLIHLNAHFDTYPDKNVVSSLNKAKDDQYKYLTKLIKEL